MPTIEVRRSHALGKERARQAAERLAQRLRDRIDVRYEWAGDELRFERTGARGHVRVGDQEVHVRIELGMLLVPMKSTIEGKLHRYLDEALGSA
ncbi:MAG: polyhydroxyalkanoic acid system family protein [Myxococcota bacterium]|nr:polyhydroxyalkanoic acid system family protein [Myxococcota bacterium]